MQIIKFPWKKRDAASLNKEFYAWLVGGDDELNVSGYTRLADSPEVNAAVDEIANRVSAMTIQLFENSENGDLRIKDELAHKVDVNPYSLGTRKTFISWIIRTMLLRSDGSAYVLPVTQSGYLQDLVPMPNAAARADGAGYVVDWNGRTFKADEVLAFICRPDLDYPWKGVGLRVQLKDVTTNLRQAAATKKSFMGSKFQPTLIVKVDAADRGFRDPESRSKFSKEYLMTSQAGEPWILPADLIDVQQVKPLTLQDLAINDAVTLDKRTVASILRVPAFLLGVGEFNADEYNNFIRTTVMDYAQCIQMTLTKGLLLSSKRYFKMSARSLYATSLKDMAEVVTKLKPAGLISGNEGRDWIGLTPRTGLDEITILENYIPAEKAGEQKKLIQEDEHEE